MTSLPIHPASLLGIPYEIRQFIYIHTIADATASNPYNTSPTPHALLSTCRQLRSEYISHHYASHIFHLHVLGRSRLAFGPLTMKNSEILFRHSLATWKALEQDIRGNVKEIMLCLDKDIVIALQNKRSADMVQLLNFNLKPHDQVAVGTSGLQYDRGLAQWTDNLRIESMGVVSRFGTLLPIFNSERIAISMGLPRLQTTPDPEHDAIPVAQPTTMSISPPSPPLTPPPTSNPTRLTPKTPFPWLNQALSLAPELEVLHIQCCVVSHSLINTFINILESLIAPATLPRLMRISIHIDSSLDSIKTTTDALGRVKGIEWRNTETYSLATCAACGTRHLREEIWVVRDKRRVPKKLEDDFGQGNGKGGIRGNLLVWQTEID